MTDNKIGWEHLCVDFWSHHLDPKCVKDLVAFYKDKMIDLRPYMIEQPYFVLTTDKLPKVLEMFRHFHLRAVPVIDPSENRPVAMITR
jgi:CBS domain-containing protein